MLMTKQNQLFFTLIILADVSLSAIINDNYGNNTQPSLKVYFRRDTVEKLKEDFYNHYLDSVIKSIKPFDLQYYSGVEPTNITIYNFTLNLAQTNLSQVDNRTFAILLQQPKFSISANVNITEPINHTDHVNLNFQTDDTRVQFYFDMNEKKQIQINKTIDISQDASWVTYIKADNFQFADYIRKLYPYTFNDRLRTFYTTMVVNATTYIFEYFKQRQYWYLDIQNQIQIDRKLSNYPNIDANALTIESDFGVLQNHVQQNNFESSVSFPEYFSNKYEIGIMIHQNFFNNVAYTYFKLYLLQFYFSYEQIKNHINLNPNQFISVLPELVFKYGQNKPMSMNIIVLKEPKVEISSQGITIDLEARLDFFFNYNYQFKSNSQYTVDPILSTQNQLLLKGSAFIINTNILQFNIQSIDLKFLKSCKGNIQPSFLFQINGQRFISDILQKIIPIINKEVFHFGLDLQSVISEYYNMKNPNITYQEKYIVIGTQIENIKSNKLYD